MEESILLFIQNNIRNPVLDPVFTAITHLGDGGIFWIILTVFLLCFPKTRRAGAYSACALLGSLLVNNLILKNLVNRTRPYEVIEGLVCLVSPAKDASFPSGHTGASFASAVAIYRQLPKRYGVLLLILAALIAFSRLYVGIHYPTDVLGGLVTGVALGLLTNLVGERIRT
ncbi:MAG: phosphatase PAP2 family protein [Lachnospiraceae bacterium]|nr:phosphatase PAP2 family protein [Lachnospiraceae bacterium]